MKAYKCDRCGTLYEYDSKDLENGTIFMGRRPYNNTFFDLCPKCQKALVEWFNDGKKRRQD